jgi:hypothetical protein
MGFMEVTAIRTAIVGLFRRQVMGSQLPEEASIAIECDGWLQDNGDPVNLRAFFEKALKHLTAAFPSVKKTELQAHFALKAISKCVALT